MFARLATMSFSPATSASICGNNCSYFSAFVAAADTTSCSAMLRLIFFGVQRWLFRGFEQHDGIGNIATRQCLCVTDISLGWLILLFLLKELALQDQDTYHTDKYRRVGDVEHWTEEHKVVAAHPWQPIGPIEFEDREEEHVDYLAMEPLIR